MAAIGATSLSTDGSIKDRELGWQYSATRARPSPQPSHDGHGDNDHTGRRRAAIKDIVPVAEIMRRLVTETEAALSRAVEFR